jgi:hypothetical protein
LGGVMARYMPGRLITQAMTVFPEPDRAVLAKPETQKVFIHIAIRFVAQQCHWSRPIFALRASPRHGGAKLAVLRKGRANLEFFRAAAHRRPLFAL